MKNTSGACGLGGLLELGEGVPHALLELAVTVAGHVDDARPCRDPANLVGLGHPRPAGLSGAIIVGVLTMAMANEPDLSWGEGRFTPMFPTLMQSLVTAYPP
ncbi:MAG TPA: hypothetical protein VHN36_03260, partial [Ilumatobacteraceae bacterium]|nr:hypothetical protein [Ilumatobacteraceae bacterium]